MTDFGNVCIYERTVLKKNEWSFFKKKHTDPREKKRNEYEKKEYFIK